MVVGVEIQIGGKKPRGRSSATTEVRETEGKKKKKKKKSGEEGKPRGPTSMHAAYPAHRALSLQPSRPIARMRPAKPIISGVFKNFWISIFPIRSLPPPASGLRPMSRTPTRAGSTREQSAGRGTLVNVASSSCFGRKNNKK